MGNVYQVRLGTVAERVREADTFVTQKLPTQAALARRRAGRPGRRPYLTTKLTSLPGT